MHRIWWIIVVAALVLFGCAMFFAASNLRPATAEDMEALNRARDVAVAEPFFALALFLAIYWFLIGRRREDLSPGLVLLASLGIALPATVALFWLLMENMFRGERGAHLPVDGFMTALSRSWPLVALAVIVCLGLNLMRVRRLGTKGQNV